MQIKVLTFNIHHGKGLDKMVNLRRISNVIKSSKANIIGLNEVDKHFSKRSDYEDQAQWLAKDLNMEYVFGPAITLRGKGQSSIRQYGNALLTQFPIIKSKNHPFDFLPRVVEDRALLEVDIKVNNRILTIFVTHLSLAPFLHQKQTQFILETVAACNYVPIMMGDWNMKPFSKSWRLITSQLKDTNTDHKSNFTFPSRRPTMKLDYIFVNPQVEVLNAGSYAYDLQASDHLPFLATLKINLCNDK
ncbi:endonuclease/exonuclease/phosphatase family metal-dependent hydrolase [Evansella vedderi]|uniref:Endonuclease/exonuclease/phosphatase family metal-dependent hydrolase n=1 Tax=Evansella vedderi TaxID=38282 RepID=A0ABT9ZZN1_9BACI|nr:endonuclease/exonuclease/phosphatase family protein [Evansella vedderi]MDQ0256314.1 endonuclease/exonuclease/phosphatase family metal-dependent hydrolase [Evansella vedderi]